MYNPVFIVSSRCLSKCDLNSFLTDGTLLTVLSDSSQLSVGDLVILSECLSVDSPSYLARVSESLFLVGDLCEYVFVSVKGVI